MEEMKISRGMLTEEIKAKSSELFGYEISRLELRLMPYVQYCVLNNKDVDARKVNGDERLALAKWTNLGFIKSPSTELRISKEFWDGMNEILWLGYVESTGRVL